MTQRDKEIIELIKELDANLINQRAEIKELVFSYENVGKREALGIIRGFLNGSFTKEEAIKEILK